MINSIDDDISLLINPAVDHGTLIAANFGIHRSSKWTDVARAHLLKQPCCLCCGSTERLNVHHKFPFHYVTAIGRPDLELDERNLYTLCVNHADAAHILIGHLGNYASYNPDLEHFIALSRNLTSYQIRSMREWIDAVAKRPKPLNEMSKYERDMLKVELDRLMPIKLK